LNDGHDRYAKKRVSGQGCASWGLHNIRLHLGGQMQNKVKGSRERVTWPTFEILGPPPNLRNRWS